MLRVMMTTHSAAFVPNFTRVWCPSDTAPGTTDGAVVTFRTGSRDGWMSWASWA